MKIMDVDRAALSAELQFLTRTATARLIVDKFLVREGRPPLRIGARR